LRDSIRKIENNFAALGELFPIDAARVATLRFGGD